MLVLEVNRFISQLETEHIHVPVVACGLQGTNAKKATDAIHAGAKEYLTLPPDPKILGAMLEAVSAPDVNVIYKDPKMDEIINLATKVAPSNASVLITGESGTGKEVLAKYLHAKSNRNEKNFVAINCAAIPENLLESELFGHEKGAFSGALTRRIGKFEEAHQGTILLDEITEMDMRLQAKLLRVIQERVLIRLGSNQPIQVDVRILATSNRRIEDYINEGLFREDLYFRLNVVNITLPPLSERPLDVELLSNYFIKKYCDYNKLPPKKLHAKAVKKLQNHHWPGNVRELENYIHRAVLLSDEHIIYSDNIVLTGYNIKPKSSDSSGYQARTLQDMEKDHIYDTLRILFG